MLIGRAYAYALGAAGGPGVARALAILRADILRTLKLLGCASVAELDRSFLDADERTAGAMRLSQVSRLSTIRGG